MRKSKHVIIGAGPAAMAAAQAIRSINKNDDIKMVSKETCPPYSPAALPYLFDGEITERALFMKGEEYLADLNITLEKGREVVQIQPEIKAVRFRDGATDGYDKLLVAAGAQPQIPQIQGLENCDFHTLRTFEDYRKIKKALAPNANIAIYGAGLVAIEMAEKLAHAGHAVTIICRSTFLRRYFNPRIVRTITKDFGEHNINILHGCSLVSVEKDNGKLSLQLTNGQNILADIFVVATGVLPAEISQCSNNTEQMGLEVGRYLNTDLPEVYAAGDIAAAPSFFDGTPGLNPILTEAVAQGRVAGCNMAGEETEYRGWISANFLRCFHHHIFNLGITDPKESLASNILEKEGNEQFLRLVLKEGCLIGVECLNMPPVNPGVFRYLIYNQVQVDRYTDSLLAKPGEVANWLMMNHRRQRKMMVSTKG
jgi:NADPH-dependent 2,4-dienoyl-CoA reductase/sulfur reductase-like enzyme